MLFAALFREKAGSSLREQARRMSEMAERGSQPPPGIEQVGVYELAHGDIRTINLFKADSSGPIMAHVLQWSDAFDVTVVPAVTWEDAVELLKKVQV